MAKEITVTITESWTGDTGTVNSTREKQISDIVDIYKRIVTVPANTDTTVATFDAAISDQTTCPFDVEAVKYIRITNLSSSNPVYLNLTVDGDANGSADSVVTFLVEAGESWLHWGCDATIKAQDTDGTTLTATLGDLTSIIADSAAAAAIVEIVIASLTAT